MFQFCSVHFGHGAGKKRGHGGYLGRALCTCLVDLESRETARQWARDRARERCRRPVGRGWRLRAVREEEA